MISHKNLSRNSLKNVINRATKFLANVMGFFAKYYFQDNCNIELMLSVYCIVGRFYLINL